MENIAALFSQEVITTASSTNAGGAAAASAAEVSDVQNTTTASSLLPSSPASFSFTAAAAATKRSAAASAAELQAQTHAAAGVSPPSTSDRGKGAATGNTHDRSCPWAELHSTKLAAPASIFSLAHVVGSSSSKNNTNAPSNATASTLVRTGGGGGGGDDAGEADLDFPDVPDLVGIMSPGLPVLTMECASVTSTAPPSSSSNTSAAAPLPTTVIQVREYQNKLPHLPDTAELISMAAFYYDSSKTTVALAVAFLHKDTVGIDGKSGTGKSTGNAGGGGGDGGGGDGGGDGGASSFFATPSSQHSNTGGRSNTASSGAGDGKDGLEVPYLHIYLCSAGLRSPRLCRREMLPFMPFCLGSLHLGYGGEEVFAVCCGDASTLVFSPIRSKLATEPAGAAGTAVETLMAAGAAASISTGASRGRSDLAPIAETSSETSDGGSGGRNGGGRNGGGGGGGGSGGDDASQQATPAKQGGSSSQKDGGNDSGGGGKEARAPPFLAAPHCSASTLSKDGGNLSELYPEFGAVAAPALCMDVWFAEVGGARASVVGCQDGWCRLTYVPGECDGGGGGGGGGGGSGGSKHSAGSGDRGLVPIEQQVQFRGPITVAKFFTTSSDSCNGHHDVAVHLLVGCAVELAVVYWDVERAGLTAVTKLAESDRYDSITCGIITTLFDGTLELLLGTYGEQVLSYSITTTAIAGNGTTSDGATMSTTSNPTTRKAAELQWRRPFPFPVYSMAKIDLTGDGLDEMVVLTMYGVHVLQQDLNVVHAKIVELLQGLEAAVEG